MNESKVTVEELKEWIAQAFKEREVVEAKKDELKACEAVLDEIEKRILTTLEALNLRSFKTEFGNVETRRRESVRVPQGDRREEFFNYLKERGIFDAMITVNSQTLNGWYKAESENAMKESKMLIIPGIEMPTAITTLVLKKTK